MFSRFYIYKCFVVSSQQNIPSASGKFLKQEEKLTIEEAFGEVIRDLRKENQISQERLAEVSSLDRSFISLLECGHKQPSLITIFQLAKSFNIAASKFLALVEEKIKT
jgi:DNA-binding XRE family transcriptional regulator